ncbi:pyruvate phosphate dikinase, PEP/pyruvate binding domain-containing protein [Hirsutella rhossiliensis]|uniref:pyruvate, water dikinase n=1 Tax=Hirsutella rhossiliensis TaxID=111463 RepID=A0A9P8N959_9HYPO|nr:pyruvate phosphate dikinase, PEP/pyruvate binding domain-containing protein [Hirsutella rhossiliensis]KAH0968812.1 pyruvate phosphate dikinase, PEP/pyruvate binding domain-containing protein [Hirsutella rhossiliensis]
MANVQKTTNAGSAEDLVVGFEHLGRGDVALVGGKNSSLGEMISALSADGIAVPPGFATTSHAYWQYVDCNDIRDKMAAVVKEWQASKLTLAEAGQAVRSLFLRGTWPGSAAAAIRTAYRQLSAKARVETLSVAVRSSATAEDLPDASFAGQQDTYLNISGEDALLDACRRCYASLFTDRAISYRQMQGFDQMSVALSVGVQQMVRSDSGGSGVMFSIDTESGFDSVVLIGGARNCVVIHLDHVTTYRPQNAAREIVCRTPDKKVARSTEMAADDSYTAADERARAARRAGIQAKKDEQPANTTRSYAAKQREWKAWCHTPRAAADGSLYSWPDGELVTPDKLAAWLKEDILLRRVVPPQKKKPRAREQLEAAAMAEAESLAEALEVPLAEAAELLADDREGYVPPTGLATAAVDLTEGSLLTRGTIDAYIAAVIELWRLQVAHGNANTENPGRRHRGSDGIQAGYLPDEWLRIQDLLLTGAAYTPQNLRTRVDLLFGHYYLLRGENRRKMELADLSLLDYPPSEARPLWLPGPSTALLWRWHVAGEPPRPSGAELSVGAQDAETHGTSLAQISQAGRWNQSVLCQAYLTHLPRQFMRIVAGFSASRGLLPRACGSRTPYVLQKQLWPWIEVGTRFEARARRQCWAEGGLDDDDLAADGFLKLMRRLRIVLLQDLAVLQLRYPSLPFFAYAPFGGPEWDEFAVAVRSTAVGAMEPVSLLVRRALPELSGVIESTREALLQNSQRLAIRLEARLDGIQGGLDALLQGKVPITFTGYFGAGAAEAPAPAPAPSTVPTLNLNTAPAPAPAPAPEPLVPGMPIVTALARVFTVGDVWKEWGEGFAGQKAVRELEETWEAAGAGNGVRVQFCRRKVIWDELLARMASGKCKEAAVAELELLRAGRSLNRLVDELKQRRRRGQDRGQGQGQIRVQLEVRAVGAEDPAGKADRPRRRKPAAS